MEFIQKSKNKSKTYLKGLLELGLNLFGPILEAGRSFQWASIQVGSNQACCSSLPFFLFLLFLFQNDTVQGALFKPLKPLFSFFLYHFQPLTKTFPKLELQCQNPKYDRCHHNLCQSLLIVGTKNFPKNSFDSSLYSLFV